MSPASTVLNEVSNTSSSSLDEMAHDGSPGEVSNTSRRRTEVSSTGSMTPDASSIHRGGFRGVKHLVSDAEQGGVQERGVKHLVRPNEVSNTSRRRTEVSSTRSVTPDASSIHHGGFRGVKHLVSDAEQGGVQERGVKHLVRPNEVSNTSSPTSNTFSRTNSSSGVSARWTVAS
jgi:hypothetical protein